ncbi:MAG TPA: adenylate/guanylate cyclase domain-containing protein [Candidatus Tectomicrobia bacterium]|nr:adenylate/guanylate cyclase domain-containing protein [Candidatus Tectomicrobia bacterium]
MSTPQIMDTETATPLPKHAIKVLLVDDQAIIGEAVRRLLATEEDIIFRYCSDPTAALHIANEFAPTVILQDLVMPDIDGLMLVRFFRANAPTRNIPLIVLSTKEEPKVKAEAFALGANDYLVKLPDKLELIARIRYHSKGYISLLERNDAYKALEQMANQLQLHNRFIRKTFGRYLTDDVVNSLLESPEGLKLGGERRKITLVMTDLRGYTSMSGRLAPEQVVTMLNRYLGTMVEVIQRYQGTIDEFIGDMIFILFGAPIQREDDAERAVACAMAMQLAMAEVNAQNRADGLPEVEMGIGIHTGEVVVGNIGSDKRAKYGVVGSHVNLTARIESYTIGGQVLISEATRQEVGPIVEVAEKIEVAAKGIDKPMSIYKARGIGGNYNLFLPERTDTLVSLPEAIPLQFTLLEGKHMGDTVFTGSLVKLSARDGEVRSEYAVERWSNIKVQLIRGNGEELPGDLYAKVMGAPPDDSRGFAVHFTSVPPEVAAFFERLLASSSPPHTA